jgi:signal transduction histidine kinase
MRGKSMGITLRTALLSWLVTIVTLLIFVGVIIPQQKRTFLENLESKAHSVAVSLHDVAAGAAVNEDCSSVVDHCKEMLNGDQSLDCLVITKNDGFSLIHERTGWRVETASSVEWHPETRKPSSGIGVVPLFNRRVFRYAQPFDYSGIQWGWIQVGLSLQSYDRSVASVYRRTGVLAVVCIVFSLLASVAYAKRLMRPILGLRTVVQKVAGGDLSARASVGRNDELGSLADSANSMTEALLRRDRILVEANETLEQRVSERTRELREQVAAKERALAELAEAQQKLIDTSRQAGMAEVATGVLHNVGNVLNSVNVSTTLVLEHLRRSEIPTMLRLARMLQEHEADMNAFLTNHPQGRKVPNYIIKLAELLNEEHVLLQKEHEQLLRNVEHIKEIVAMQQSYAHVSGVLEEVSLGKLVNDALQINLASLSRTNIRIIRNDSEVPRIIVDKHKLLQILINLIGNAKYALDASGHME